MKICDCYQIENGKPVCYGTKEREECVCNGVESNCYKRKDTASSSWSLIFQKPLYKVAVSNWSLVFDDGYKYELSKLVQESVQIHADGKVRINLTDAAFHKYIIDRIQSGCNIKILFQHCKFYDTNGASHSFEQMFEFDNMKIKCVEYVSNDDSCTNFNLTLQNY